jgi:hypothetical protein
MRYSEIAMNRSRQLGALVLLLVWLLVPAMACTLPDAQMTPAERACCVQMHDQCGGMDMPASHSCCHKQMPTERSAVVHSNATLAQPAILGYTVAAQLAMPSSYPLLAHSLGAVLPQSPPSSITILRT